MDPPTVINKHEQLRHFYGQQLVTGQITDYTPEGLSDEDEAIINAVLLSDLKIIVVISIIGSLIAVAIFQVATGVTEDHRHPANPQSNNRIYIIAIILFLVLIFYIIIQYLILCKARR